MLDSCEFRGFVPNFGLYIPLSAGVRGGLAVSAGRRCVEGEVYPYLLRNTRITRPNQMWAADITYLPMARGFLYLVVVMDSHSRYVVATPWKSVFASALTEALDRGRPDLFNTGQGS